MSEFELIELIIDHFDNNQDLSLYLLNRQPTSLNDLIMTIEKFDSLMSRRPNYQNFNRNKVSFPSEQDTKDNVGSSSNRYYTNEKTRFTPSKEQMNLPNSTLNTNLANNNNLARNNTITKQGIYKTKQAQILRNVIYGYLKWEMILITQRTCLN